MRMRLLVSVRNAVEAAAALAGGAHIVDAKEPSSGALGPVRPDVLGSIARAVGGAAPVSAALGDWETAVARRAESAASRGTTLVKIGFAGSPLPGPLVHEVAALVAAVRPVLVILVAYADHDRAHAPSPGEVVMLARDAGAAGVLLDTCDKQGSGLTALLSRPVLRQFVCGAHAHGQTVALAGKLTAGDLAAVCSTGADIAGFRGAACDEGRTGAVAAWRVRALRAAIDATKGTRERPRRAPRFSPKEHREHKDSL